MAKLQPLDPTLQQEGRVPSSVLVVDRVLGPVLAQGSTAMGSLTCRVKPERLAPPGKMGMKTSTIIAKNGLCMHSMYEYGPTSTTPVC